MKPLSIREVGRLFGIDLPDPPGKARCPLRDHKRSDRTFRIYVSREGSPLWFCWSCDAPNNKGDAISLFALLTGTDRKAAWKRLAAEGYNVPGLGEDGWRGRSEEAGRREYQKISRNIPRVGTQPKIILPFDPKLLNGFTANKDGAIADFARKRGMRESFLREHGVIDMGGRLVGFVYYHPDTHQPCRIKVRGVDEKIFWIEPKPAKDDKSGARAYAPLFLASEIIPPSSPLEAVIITEGEPDALALRSTGILNVVSLPDGAASALTADISPLYDWQFGIWMVATDDDEAGEKAFHDLRSRAAQVGNGIRVIRVKFRSMDDAGELRAYKDANDALLDGFTQEDFVICMEMAAEERGQKIDWKMQVDEAHKIA